MSPILSPNAAKLLNSSYIWYDYFGIPQVNGPSKMRAIQSIPSYISRATYLFVLAPSLPHNDLPTVVNKGTWQQRGWCRVEQSIYSLTRKGIADTAALTIHHAGFVQESVPMQWLYALPHKGDFTSEADRDVIEKMIGKVASNRVVRPKLQENPFDWRFMKSVLRYVSGNVSVQTEVNAWLRDMAFGRMTDAGSPDGWQPIHFATCEGNIAVVSSLLAAGIFVDAPTLGRGYSVMAARGLTPLMVAANYIPNRATNVEMVKHLVSSKADIHARNDSGQQAIHFAALGPEAAESLEFLLSCKADAMSRDAAGETPLHCATLTNATANVMRLEAIELLLKAGADPQAVGGDLGLTPWHFLVPTGGPVTVQHFLDIKCDPNLQLPRHAARDVIKPGMVKHVEENIAATLAVHGEGLTPLMFGVWIGNWETCEVLLKNGADANLQTSTGRTAMDWLHDSKVFGGPTLELLKKYSGAWNI
mmetsp:Transcript_5809/g.12721  ORF Transcript_5809/g.12721 Transcript_5809/m.12721 type:complete len:475 (+) Transcript_5809:448-1872(+)